MQSVHYHTSRDTAFHDHKIGVHKGKEPEDPNHVVSLIPVLDISNLTEREQLRCRSLAQVALLRTDPSNARHNHLGTEAAETLVQLRNSGPVDAVIDRMGAKLDPASRISSHSA